MLLRDGNDRPVIETKSGVPWDGRTLRWEGAPRDLAVSSDGLTLSWKGAQDAVWLCSRTTARMKDGVFSWEFVIEEIAEHQIGVGALLDPPNWGAFGYLGAGSGAWAYDAYEGAIVTEENAIHKNLPAFSKSGIVAVLLDLQKAHTLTFVVDGKKTPPLQLPPGATVIPAACLLKPGQVVTLRNFRREPGPATGS